MQTLGHGIWQENLTARKMRKSLGRTWNMARNTEKRNEKCTLQDVEYGKTHWKT